MENVFFYEKLVAGQMHERRFNKTPDNFFKQLLPLIAVPILVVLLSVRAMAIKLHSTNIEITIRVVKRWLFHYYYDVIYATENIQFFVRN